MSIKGVEAEDDYGSTAIAIDGDKNSQFAVRWAIDNLVTTKNSQCALIHVQCKTLHPMDHHATTPNRDGRAPNQQELQQFFLPYRGFCARRGIETKEIVIHDIDISNALIDYISYHNIANIVVGASHRNAITRKFKQPDVPSTLLKSAPESCAVYVICKGKVQTFRLANRPPAPLHPPPSPSPSIASSHHNHMHHPQSSSTGANNKSGIKQHPQYHRDPTDLSLDSPRQHHPSLKREFAHLPFESPRQSVHKEFNLLPTVSQISVTESWKSESSDRISSIGSPLTTPQEIPRFSFRTAPRNESKADHSSEFSKMRMHSVSNGSEFSGPISVKSTDTNYDNIEFTTTSEISNNNSSAELASFLELEMRRLKLELQQSMELFNSVTKESVLTKQMVRDFQGFQTFETRKPEETKLVEGATLTLAAMEKQKKKAALEAVQAAKRLATIEKQKKILEEKAQFQVIERPQNMEAKANNEFRCRRYTIDEIETATDHFEPANKIGEGGYGPVFKGTLNHISVAIKILRPDLSQGQKQFRQEVDVLSNMRHPHMVILLGACPEYGCLVYEYMDNGSLEDRLYRKDKTPPIPWRTRFKIAFEIATALLFLHETKPEPLVHRDLKPANILLDYNYVSKISDVGLARLVPQHLQNNVTQYHMTAAAGTFCYIDPEYQQTGMLGVKSDLYSFGVVLLQILTAKPPMGLSYHVEDAIENGRFMEILDPSVKNWPVEEALALAKIALQCCELRKKDRPDLGNDVLPLLAKLRNLAISRDNVQHETIMPLPSPVDLISEAQSSSSEVSYYGI